MRRQSAGVGVVVDGYSSGSLFRPFLDGLNYRVIHVQSRADMPSRYRSSVESEYEANFIFSGNLEELFRQLSAYDVRFVVPGTDPGVVLAAQIAEHFKIASNSVECTKSLKNKFVVNEICKKAGLRSAGQCLTGDWNKAETWAKNHNKWPIVAKPVSGNGSHAVHVVQGMEELKKVFHSLRSSLDVLANPIEEVLLQEFLIGVEYFVDTVSCDGKHYVTDVFRYSKIKSNLESGAKIYDFDDLLCLDENVKSLITYALAVLDAVGFQYGAAHIEIVETSAGPALVELNPRIIGGRLPNLIRIATDCDPIAMTFEAIADPMALAKRSPIYQKTKHARFVCLNSKLTGVVLSCPYLEELQKLPSYVSGMPALPGTHLVPTRDLTTTAGSIFLAHENPDIVQSDYQKIREWEAKGMFELSNL